VLFVIGGTVTAEFLRHDVLRSLPLERSDDGKEGRDYYYEESNKGRKKRRRGGRALDIKSFHPIIPRRITELEIAAAEDKTGRNPR